MDLNFKCPLCDTYFSTQDDLKEHVKASHTSYYYDTYLAPPLLIYPSETAVLTTGATDTVITTEPIVTEEVTVEPVVVEDDGCCECDCCCCSDGNGVSDGGADCDCDCDCCGDCVIM
ncbi:uncharacterized protein LOC129770342 [Toxorhynchites rutilus septentrionalis]|uniref:uncharacterized protein LOC129770342 n=1 Tax=Toxorhynchites rutilus septentrionalis TaxID=329112 RepID=UPI00247A6EAC|nr:uncharacterized protein LOC129770342 [Toxorhynchites rutilus septentrionalis]